MEVVNPSVMVSRLEFGGSGLCGGWNWFSSTPLGFLEYWGIYRAKRRCGRPPRWAQPTWARMGARASPGGLCPPGGTPQVLLRPIGCLLVHKNSTKSFPAFGLRLALISCDVKNMQKIATGNGHYVNRLVPKDDIKLLENEGRTSKIDI